jgi:hypothetical protein
MLNDLGILSFELDWREELKQEFYIHWIDLVESKHPRVLQGFIFVVA